MTLKKRFALSFIGNTVAVLVVFGGAYYVRDRRAAQTLQREEQLKTVRTAATQCGAMQLSENPIAALDYINAVKRDSAVLSVACLDPRGRIQVHSDPQKAGKSVQEPETLEMLKGRDPNHRIFARADGISVLAWYAPILAGPDNGVGTGRSLRTFAGAGPDIAGWAEVDYRRDILEARIRERLWSTLNQLAWVGAFTFVLAIVLGLALAWSLSAPIGGLVTTVRAIAAGDLKQQTDLMNRNDELGFLAKEINLMAARLAQLDEVKDQFIASVSHDLRSPVAAIGMYLQWMLEGDPDNDKILPKHRAWLTTLRENGMRLSAFVTNILDGAKMKAGRMEYDLQAVAPEETLRKIKTLFEFMASNQGIALELELPGPLPDIRADPHRFDQVVTNLVSNALKFTKRGGRVVLGARTAGGRVEVVVADTGRGMSKEDLAKIFERFRQFGVSGIQSTEVKGTGIGLAISKEAVEAMGGSIAVESEPGKGSRFTVRMPLWPGGPK